MREPRPGLSARYDGLDAIRAGAMLLGLAYHATYAWLPRVAPWYFVADSSPVDALVFVTGFLHAFRMQLFFALSGLFSHLVFERRGERGFLVDRSRRLLVPLAVALPIVLGLDVLLRRASHARGLMSAEYLPGTAFHLAPVHLWFLVYLFTFCVLAWALPTWSGPSRFVARLLRWPPLLLGVFAIPSAALLWWQPEMRPDTALWPKPLEVLHYGAFFAFGWWLWPSREALGALRAWAWPLLVAGVALGVFVFHGTVQWEPLGHALAGVVAWLMTLGGFGLAFRIPSGERPWLRYLVQASYWVYLTHYPVVLGLQLFFAQQALPGTLEYAATVGLTFLVTLISFELFVRKTRLGPWLGVKS